MLVRVDGASHRGRAVDLTDDPVDGATVVTAIRQGRCERPVEGAAARRVTVTVACLQPAPVHERVGHVRPGMGLQVRTALAEAARTRGMEAPQDERRRELGERLAALDAEAPEIERVRRRRAGTDADVERLRERVATIRGRLAAAREAGRDAADLEADLAEAARRLSEAETERAAADEALERARDRAREARDRRERRRRLEDERANLDRAARAHLVDRLREAFAESVAAAPGSDADPSDPFDADPVTAALAVCRVADLHAPVVLACDRFDGAASAARWLDAPVVRVGREG